MKNTAFLITENHYPKDYVLKESSDSDSAMGIAKRILAEVMIFRRVPEAISLCGAGCQNCASPHLPKIISAVKKNEPVTFILPAFPGKSPNPEKVLGPLPDHAERLSLNFLGTLCRRIKTFYTPGIKIILCSDGRVFSDVVGMNESDVTAYQVELDRLIKEMSLADLSIFNLDYFYKDLHFVQMRDELMKSYGQSLDFLKHKIRNGAKPSASLDEQETNRMYSGITRFLFEDAMHAGQTKSRTAIQKESRSKAYEVIRRSNAWSALISERFPNAVRLSIHPQTCGSKKLGIRLIGNESWMTPWHGVAVESKKGYALLKRSEAEALGAKLICSSDGRYSHYQLMAEV
ncbi:isocyanide synthase family protein [Legionella sp. PATHC032]|uniref:isocyanide synthase family protein n=1 Tax=Legionella sp. PATHC032 TaxID=2992039 RepID=UPI001B1A33CE|nr:isocyanide synthase family protein [Legionella sp. PATHC032]MCW8420197.1 isocyanide synthase family protein [Legionella sp. PATHC032]HAZ7573062.1 L-tyrosine/L-tryptophan isonitrile synthase family protein [Legionella pneumophila]HBA1636043.1 L-tyrosine/L-tryptophan isonitrile synthase family protein [Legionella pneumophila]